MMYFELMISKVDNGYIAEYWESEEGCDPTKTQFVFEDNDTEHGEIECFARLLWYIVDHYGMTGNKNDKRRIRITTGADDE